MKRIILFALTVSSVIMLSFSGCKGSIKMDESPNIYANKSDVTEANPNLAKTYVTKNYNTSKVEITFPFLNISSNGTDAINENILNDIKSFSSTFDLDNGEFISSVQQLYISDEIVSIIYYYEYSSQTAAYPQSGYYTQNYYLDNGMTVKSEDLLDIYDIANKIYKLSDAKVIDFNANVENSFNVVIDEGLIEAQKDYLKGLSLETIKEDLFTAGQIVDEHYSEASIFVTEDKYYVVFYVVHAIGDSLVAEIDK